MPFVYSTLSCDQKYTNYHNTEIAGPNVVAGAVLIKGGANVAQKRFIADDGTNTPAGVRTEVTDAELELLMANEGFIAHMERGFIEVTTGKEKISEIVADMTDADASAQFTDADYQEGGRALPGTEAPKVGESSEEENE